MKVLLNIILLIHFLSFLTHAQQTGQKGANVVSGSTSKPVTGNTYALIIGISEYADPLIPQLKYADDDAVAFKNYLMSKAGGSVRDTNIRIFLNKEATAMNISQKGIRWVMNKAKNEGDRVYIYFSGHGDAASEQEMFLLAHDVIAGDPYNYSVHGALQIFNLKRRILELTARKVEVFLITDACRTNEVNTVVNVPTYYTKRIMEENAGEIQFMSCSANESSYEDKRWGNGRGVFSYHLIDGLMGLADDDGNNEITVGELYEYVNKNVRKDRTDPVTKKVLQRPAFCCNDREFQVITLVDSETRNKLIAEKSGVIQQGGDLLVMGKGASAILSASDSSLIKLYRQFRISIDEGRLLKPEKNNAWFFYEQIQKHPASKPYVEDVKIDLIASLANSGQQAIEVYLKGQDSLFTNEYFSDAAVKFRYALSLVDSTDEYYPVFLSRNLFLEAKSYTGINESREKAFALMQRALKMDTTLPYIHKGIADLYYSFRNFEEAIKYYRNAIRLAPRWSVPMYDLGNLYFDLEQYDRALECFRVCYAIGNKAYAAHSMGISHYMLGSEDSAMYYYKQAMTLDTTFVHPVLGMYYIYKNKNEQEQMIKYLLQAYHMDTMQFRTLMFLGDYYYQREEYKDAYNWFHYATTWYPENSEAWMWKGYILELMKNTEAAVQCYELSVKLDEYYTPGYKQLANLYMVNGQVRKAITYYKRPLKYDSFYNPSKLAYAYLSAGDYDSCKAILDLTLKRFPGDGYALNLYGYMYLYKKNYAEAKRLFKQSLASDPNNAEYVNNLAFCHYTLGEFDSAVVWYQFLVKFYPSSAEGYKGLWKINYYVLKNYTDAADVMKSAYAAGVNSFDCVPYIIYSYIMAADYASAIQWLNVLKEDYSQWMYLYYFYSALVESARKNTDMMYQRIESALKEGLDCDYLTPGSFVWLDPYINSKEMNKLKKKYCK